MDYAFKVTTHGRAAIAACMDMGNTMRISRVAVGSGKVPEDVDLADVHELYHYVTEGAISERRHENDRLYLTVQYANSEHKEVPTFPLSEFMVYVEDPENGGETDLLYATLGDYRQPVPAYSPGIPESVFSYPMVIIVSDEIEVSVSAPSGIVTADVLEDALASIEAELNEKGQIKAEEPPTPVTEGQPGQHWFDRSAGREYVCKGATEAGEYIWDEVVTGETVTQTVENALAGYAVISPTPPAAGPALWFCSDPGWRPAKEAVATAILGDPADADKADVTGEVNDVVYPVLNATVSGEGGRIVATIEET